MATTTTVLMSEPTLPHYPVITHTSNQPIIEVEAEAEAETEIFRGQTCAVRGPVYSGPRRVVHKRPSQAKVSSIPNARRPKSLAAGQAAPSKLAPAPTEESFAEKEPSFARLIEDLLRTHSSTASPYGQHLSHSILNDNNKIYPSNFYGGTGFN